MSTFHQLMATIEDRKKNPPERSYTTQLFRGGVDKIGAKIVEEAAEVVEAAQQSSTTPERRKQVVHESVDLIYHLFVLLGHEDIRISEIETEVARRFGVSGLDEKAARPETKEN